MAEIRFPVNNKDENEDKRMIDKLDLSGKVALVTGGASGIGRSSAELLAAHGASVCIADINDDAVAERVSEFSRRNETAFGVPVDMGSVESINNMVDKTVAHFGKIDIFVNTAGVCQSKPFLEVSEKEWDLIIDINQKGSAFSMQAVAAHMVSRIPESVKTAGVADRCYGKIVNFSSISGRSGRPLQIHYASSKAAVISLTQSVALDLAPLGINVNAVSPSVVKTAMWDKNVEEKRKSFGDKAEEEAEKFMLRIPMKRPGALEEMADAVLFLSSSMSDYITGQTLNVDGGFEMN